MQELIEKIKTAEPYESAVLSHELLQEVVNDLQNDTSLCECPDEYCIEPHGNGWALYFGRCNHRHGLNIAFITEPDMKRLEEMIKKLNSK